MRAIALPVKSLGHAKSRLSSLLAPLERGALALAMFEDVLDATLAVDGWETWVVSSDESVLEIALARGAHGISELRPTLRSATLQIEAEAAARSTEALAILLADTPLVTLEALRAALHTLNSPSRAASIKSASSSSDPESNASGWLCAKSSRESCKRNAMS